MAYNIQGGKIFVNIFAWDLHNQGGKHEHGREVDADDGLEVVVLVVVGAEADDVEDRGREEDVGGDRDQLARQDELNLCTSSPCSYSLLSRFRIFRLYTIYWLLIKNKQTNIDGNLVASQDEQHLHSLGLVTANSDHLGKGGG